MFRGFVVEGDASARAAFLDLGDGALGCRVLEAFGKRLPHQRVVVWTANAGPQVRERCRGLGADQVFDRATEIFQLMDFCMVHAEAQARSASGSQFPPPPPLHAPRAAFFAI